MNTGVALGTGVFIVWSFLSGWYYVCQIKGLCTGSDTSLTSVAPPVREEEDIVGAVQSMPVDTASVVAEVPEQPDIAITEQNILFGHNSPGFLDQAYVENFAKDLKNKTEGRKVKIVIEGFTCDIGEVENNLKLGLRRAKAMESFLIASGINASKIETISGGEIPSVDNTEQERIKNRKVVITIKSLD